MVRTDEAHPRHVLLLSESPVCSCLGLEATEEPGGFPPSEDVSTVEGLSSSFSLQLYAAHTITKKPDTKAAVRSPVNGLFY